MAGDILPEELGQNKISEYRSESISCYLMPRKDCKTRSVAKDVYTAAGLLIEFAFWK